MKIWLLQTGEPLPLENGIRKMRTALLADKLLERGHSVCWWGSAFEHQRKIWIANKDGDFHITPDFTVRVIRGCGYARNVSIARYIDHRILALKFRHRARKYEIPDIILSSVPCHHISYEAARYARERRICFAVDIRDLWPDIFLDRVNMGLFYFCSKAALFNDFHRLGISLASADMLIAVSRTYLQWALDKAGRSCHIWDKVFFIGYKHNRDNSLREISKNTYTPGWIKGNEKRKLIIFLGTFGVTCELLLVLKVAKIFYEAGLNEPCFVLAGTGEQDKAIHRGAAELPNVVLPGWITTREIRWLLEKGYIGLLCYVEGAPQSIPNKFFEYLSAGVPVVSSLKGEIANMIKKHRVGLNYRAGDRNSLFYCIKKVLDKPNLREEMSRDALKFFRDFGDADRIYEDYAQHIERLVEERRGKPKVYQDETSF